MSEVYVRILNAPAESLFELLDLGWSRGIRRPLFPAESLIKFCLRANDSQREGDQRAGGRQQTAQWMMFGLQYRSSQETVKLRKPPHP